MALDVEPSKCRSHFAEYTFSLAMFAKQVYSVIMRDRCLGFSLFPDFAPSVGGVGVCCSFWYSLSFLLPAHSFHRASVHPSGVSGYSSLIALNPGKNLFLTVHEFTSRTVFSSVAYFAGS